MRLSAFDAFFVAYQETSGVLMQLGVEVELRGLITREDLERSLRHIVRRQPPLGQRLRRRWFGLAWEGDCRPSEMLQVAESREALEEWRNRPLNPFAEPPFQLLWIVDNDTNVLAFRAHHAVVDGEGFFAVCVEVVRALAATDYADTGYAEQRRTVKHLRVTEALRNLQRLRSDARAGQSARLAMRRCIPGAIAIVVSDLKKDDFRELKEQARELNVAPGWLCAAAWSKAIHSWNQQRRNDSSPLISLEAPVSLRRSRDARLRLGNCISPLTLYADATQPLASLAIELKQQMSRAMRQQLHLALPFVTSPGKFLPWPLFRKLAARPEFTGLATSHFAWFEQSQAIHEEISRESNGALQIVEQRIYTPVCLHMGAALAVLAWPERAQIFLTHRLAALSGNEARSLLDLMVQELGRQCLSRQQVAV